VDTTGAAGSTDESELFPDRLGGITAAVGRELGYLRLKDCPHSPALASGVVMRFGSDGRQFPNDDVGADGQTRSNRYHGLPEVKSMS
jgi:hypothetical protein